MSGDNGLKKKARSVEHILDRVCRVCLAISGVAIFMIMLTTSYGVFRRYALNAPEPYSYEIGVILFLICIILAIPLVQKDKRNIRVDFLANRFSKIVQFFLTNIFVPVSALFYVVLITWQGGENAVYSFQIHETSQSVWREQLWPIKIVIPVGLGLLCLVLISQLILGIIAFKRGQTNKSTGAGS